MVVEVVDALVARPAVLARLQHRHAADGAEQLLFRLSALLCFTPLRFLAAPSGNPSVPCGPAFL